jgi:hypothetical protein
MRLEQGDIDTRDRKIVGSLKAGEAAADNNDIHGSGSAQRRKGGPIVNGRLIPG